MIFLLRHGETAAEGQRRFIGWTDLPLTDGGRRQARRCGRELASGRIASIWCSDLLRAKETAEIISRRIGVPIRSTTALREIHLGAWEGLEMAEVRRCDPEAWRLRGDRLPDFRPPGGESFRDLADRVLPEFASIAAAGDTDILVVGHAGVNRVILCSYWECRWRICSGSLSRRARLRSSTCNAPHSGCWHSAQHRSRPWGRNEAAPPGRATQKQGEQRCNYPSSSSTTRSISPKLVR